MEWLLEFSPFLIVVGRAHLDIVNLANTLKDSVSRDLQSDIIYVDIGKEFITEHGLTLRYHMLKWVWAKVVKLSFIIVIIVWFWF